VSADELTAVRGLRRALHSRDAQTSLETLLDRVRKTGDNAAFLRLIRTTVPSA
jgi:transcription termination factor Rho